MATSRKRNGRQGNTFLINPDGYIKLLTSFGNLLSATAFLMTQSLQNVPCWVLFWSGHIGNSLYIFSFATRAIRLRHLFRINQLKLKIELQGSGSGSLDTFGRGKVAKREKEVAGAGFYGGDGSQAGSVVGSILSSVGGSDARMMGSIVSVGTDVPVIRGKKGRQWKDVEVHIMALTGVMLVIGSWCAVVTARSPFFSIHPTSYYCPLFVNNKIVWEFWPNMVVSVGWGLIICPVLVWLFWKANDTHGIRRDLMILGFVTPFVTIAALVSSNTPSGRLPNESTFQVWFPGTNWYIIAILINQWVAVALPVLEAYGFHPIRKFTRCCYHRGRRVSRLVRERGSRGTPRSSDVSTASGGGIDDMSRIPLKDLFEWAMEDPQCFEAFKAFAARDFTTENPMFFHEYRKLMFKVKTSLGDIAKDSVTSKRESISISSPVSQQQPDPLPFGTYLPPSITNLPIPAALVSDYRRVYSTFVRPGAQLQLNLPAHLVDMVGRQLAKKEEAGSAPVGVLDGVRREVLGMMFESFGRFAEEEREGYLKALRKGRGSVEEGKG
ncbi:hypothetical protein HDV00_003121 [Rhizophlyctis rosea]|nr:hypothetical protein HDV00_003121 [Rhizophlyctis rosea]